MLFRSIEKIEAQLRKEQEKLKEIMQGAENTKTAKKDTNNYDSEID